MGLTNYIKLTCNKCNETHNTQIMKELVENLDVKELKLNYVCILCQLLEDFSPSLAINNYLMKR